MIQTQTNTTFFISRKMKLQITVSIPKSQILTPRSQRKSDISIGQQSQTVKSPNPATGPKLDLKPSEKTFEFDLSSENSEDERNWRKNDPEKVTSQRTKNLFGSSFNALDDDESDFEFN